MSKIYCKIDLPSRTKKRFLSAYFDSMTPETYFEDGAKQCDSHRSRSAGDLKMLLDGKFKTKTKIDDVIKILVDLVGSIEQDSNIKAIFCPHIHKIVFYNGFLHPYTSLRTDYCYNYNIGEDGLSWRTMINIYKTKQNEQ